MSRPFKIDEGWQPEAADIMVREGKTLKEAVTELAVPLSSQECVTIMRRKSFQGLLRQARNRQAQEVASDPGHNKVSLVGKLLILAEKLILEGQLDKAAEVLFKAARLEDWVGEGGQVNIFGNLTQKDLDDMKAKLDLPKDKQPNAVN